MEFITDESLKQKMIDKGKYIDASLVKLNIPANINKPKNAVIKES